jgi:uncharacterized membrane protein
LAGKRLRALLLRLPLPHPLVPVAMVTAAMVLALLCVGWLIYVINHITQSISINHIDVRAGKVR